MFRRNIHPIDAYRMRRHTPRRLTSVAMRLSHVESLLDRALSKKRLNRREIALYRGELAELLNTLARRYDIET